MPDGVAARCLHALLIGLVDSGGSNVPMNNSIVAFLTEIFLESMDKERFNDAFHVVLILQGLGFTEESDHLIASYASTRAALPTSQRKRVRKNRGESAVEV